jgi:hypothetical protein
VQSTDLRIDKTVLPYLGVLSGLCLLAQLITAARGSRIDLLAALVVVPVGLYYAYFQYTARVELSKVRFGRLVAHAAGFLIVNLSYHIHAALLLVFGKGDLLDEDWAGVLVAMFVFWGFGLLVHLIASVAMRGYEDLRA